MKKLKEKRGFTLTELLVAVVILGIITIMAIPQISNLINSNNDAKYEAYEKTIETSAKLYTDSYKEDMFGNNASGCYDIPYDHMSDKKLVQDIKINNVTCAGGSQKKTFVRVYKSGDFYRYKVSILCVNKNDETSVEYSNVIDTDVAGDTTFCDGKTLDLDGPTISLKENGATWTTGKDMTVKLTIADNFGLFENIQIRYAWTTTPGAVAAGEWKTKNFNNKRNVEKVSLTLEVPQNKSEDYYLVVEPVMVRDANGNYQTQRFKSNVFKFDNTIPTCSLSVTGDKGLNDWYITKPTISLTMDDARGEITTYTMTKTRVDEDDYSEIEFNDKNEKTQGDTKKVTWYAYVKDAAGNIIECKTSQFKVDTTPPTTPNKGKISVSGSNSAATLAVADGSTDATSELWQYRYIINNSSTVPDKNSASFTTSRDFTRSCGTTYYAYAIAVDNAGNISDVYSMGSASDGANSYSDWGTCSVKCGGGTQTRTNTCALITTGLSQECNKSACCRTGSIYYVDGSSCSKACDGGTKNRVAYAAEDHSKRCPEFDTSSGGSSCNTRACCTDSTITYKDGSSCSKACGSGTKNRLAYSTYDSSVRCSSYDKSSGGAACNTQTCCRSGSIYYVNGSTCSKSCGGGTYNRVAYAAEDHSVRCSAYDKSSGGSSCNTQACCRSGSIYYVNGSTCSKSCGGGTYNRVAYAAEDHSVRCSAYDQSSGGSSCNTRGCCSRVTYSNGSTCSASCGGGTYNRLAYSYYDGSRCSGSDTSTGGSACNTHSCCNYSIWCSMSGTYNYFYNNHTVTGAQYSSPYMSGTTYSTGHSTGYGTIHFSGTSWYLARSSKIPVDGKIYTGCGWTGWCSTCAGWSC